MRIYWISELQNGALGMMPRPKGEDWLVDEIKRLKRQGIHTVVSLIEYHEMQELGLEDEERLCKENEIDFINFPIVDCSIPDSRIKFNALVQQLKVQLNNHKKIVIHCRMGIGRTSMLSAAVLLTLGFDKKGIFEYLSKIRTLEVPDRKEQENWILNA